LLAGQITCVPLSISTDTNEPVQELGITANVIKATGTKKVSVVAITVVLILVLAVLIIALVATMRKPKEFSETGGEEISPSATTQEEAAYYYKRGISYSHKGSDKEALREFLLAAQLDPKDSSVRMHLGKAYLSQGLYLKAVEELSTAIDLNPRKAYAYYYRGKAYYERQLLSNAIEDFQSALEILPFEPVFKIALSSVLIDMERFALAADHIEGLLRKKRSRDPLLWDKLADCYLGMKQYSRAIGILKMTLKISPDSVDIRHHLAGAYFEQGDYQKAIEMYLSAIEQNPDFLEAYLNLGICYHREGDYSQTRRYLNKVLEHDPYNQKAIEVIMQLER